MIKIQINKTFEDYEHDDDEDTKASEEDAIQYLADIIDSIHKGNHHGKGWMLINSEDSRQDEFDAHSNN